MLRDVVITCAEGTEPPAAWRDAWLEAGWTIEARIDEVSTAFLLDAPANGPAVASPARDHGNNGLTVAQWEAHAADITGLVPRSAFLSHLSAVIRRPEQGCRALMAIRIDQSTDVAAHIDRTRLFELEDQISARLAALLDDADLSTIWLELGFGILVQREGSARVWDLATRLCARIADEPFTVAGAPLSITASIGLALSPPGLVDGQAWFASSYAAQGIAHRHGGNRPEGLLTREFEPMLAERVLIVREWANEAKTGGNVLIEYRALMPMKPTSPLLYYVHAKLRDLRAPLRGVYRSEYLRLARAAGAMVMIDRMSLFQAFQTLDLEYAQGRETHLIVPVELDTLRGVPWRWLDAEVRRRPHVAGGLVIELAAQHELQAADIDASLKKLRAYGVHVCLSETSVELADVATWAGMPPDFLRMSASIPEGMSAVQFNVAMSAWRVREKRLIVDGVSDANSVNLASLQMDYVGGDAVAVVSPRLEHEFAVRA